MNKPIFRQWFEEEKRYQYNRDIFDNGWVYTRFLDYDKHPLEQYTGVNDRNNKKIFEGDYVRYLGFICVVEFTQGAFILKCINEKGFFYFADMASGLLRVTGNIHEGDGK